MTTARAPIAFSLFFSDLFLQQKDQCQNTTLEKEGHVFEAFFLFSRKSNFAGKWARWEGTLSPLLLPILFGSNLPSATTNSFVEIKGRGRARLGQRSFYFQRCFSHLFPPFLRSHQSLQGKKKRRRSTKGSKVGSKAPLLILFPRKVERKSPENEPTTSHVR